MIISVLHRLSIRSATSISYYNRSPTTTTTPRTTICNPYRRFVLSNNRLFDIVGRRQPPHHQLKLHSNRLVSYTSSSSQQQQLYNIHNNNQHQIENSVNNNNNISDNNYNIMRGGRLDTISLKWLLCTIIGNNSINMIPSTSSLVFGSNSNSFGTSSSSSRNFGTTSTGATSTNIPFLVNPRKDNSVSNNDRSFSLSTTALSSKKSSPMSIGTSSDNDNTIKTAGGVSSLQASTSSTIVETDVTNTNTPPDTTTTSHVVQIVANDNEFIKPDCDQRQYRTIILPNNLQVLLVSDMMTSGVGTEAASVHVQAGHFDDTIPGLAHFHEHMLFLGTKKYPDENDYEEFLNTNGGYSNAYTDMEDTNYYFSVMTEANAECQSKVSDALYGALDRFAQFFISPTFARDSVDREVKAIDSEYKNGITNDSWRSYQLLKSLSNQQHPFSKFGCGNYDTLMSTGLDSLLTELQSFWNVYYQTYNLRLSVVGHSPLDVLEKAVIDTFGQLQYSTGEHRRINKNNHQQIFPRENAVYGGYDAFSQVGGQLGKIRNIIPITEKRCIEIYFRTPPLDDPILRQSKPYSVISHLLGHEGPGSLHDVLNSEGYINSLSSGIAVEAADFSLFQVSISVTPRGLENKDSVLDLFFQWMKLITSTDNDSMSLYHSEIRQISDMNFKFRENSDPVDFCSSSAELLFTENLDYKKILMISSETTEYDPIVANSFKERLVPTNSMISIVSSDFTSDDDKNNEQQEQWMTEKWYGAKYTEAAIKPEQIETWTNPSSIDSRLHLPAMNQYIPTDFSLRCHDDDNVTIPPVASDKSQEATIQVQQELETIAPTRKLLPPTVVTDTRALRMWHKLDSHWKVPKTYVKLSFVSPSTYSSPRTMTLNRIYQRMLNDDLNSFVYDASLAGCRYSISCTVTGYRVSVKGYSEKIPFLLETLTSRMLSLIDDMKSSANSSTEASKALVDKFNKAKEALLRETKNYRLDPPYEIASYNARLLIEEKVWYLDDYLNLMEGPEAIRHPLTIDECARIAEESLTGRVKCEAICMGNIDTKQCNEVTTVINERFLNKCNLLSPSETNEHRSMKIPTMNEAIAIYGNDVSSRTIPIIYQELANTETEENNAVEIILQIGSELDLGYERIALLDLLSHMAHTSAFNQLRTKEQLGYIVSAQARRTAGGAWGMSIVVQSSVALPDVLEERCEAWIETFRNELLAMAPDEYAQEASSVIAQLLENETTLSQEVDRVWTEILNTELLPDAHRSPVFDKYLKIAQELYLVDDDDTTTEIEGTATTNGDDTNVLSSSEEKKKKMKTAQQLKDSLIALYDEHLRVTSPKRRAMSSRVFSHNAKEQYNESLNQPGVLSSYSDMRYMKQYLGTYSTIPYWIVPTNK